MRPSRRGVCTVALLLLAPLVALAADSTHEAVARQFFSAWMKTDRERLVRAIAGPAGATWPQTRALVLTALESPEFEAIYVKHLVGTFSEQELTSLVEMSRTPAFQIFSERMPQFTERALPEVAAFFKNNTAELNRRAVERQKERRTLCQTHGPSRLPGRTGDSALTVLANARQTGYVCGEALEDRRAGVMYVACTNDKTYCDDYQVINFRYDTATMRLESINIGRSSAVIDALSKEGRLTAGTLPK